MTPKQHSVVQIAITMVCILVLPMECIQVRILVVSTGAKIPVLSPMTIGMDSKNVVDQGKEIFVGPVSTWNIVDSNVVASITKSIVVGAMDKCVVVHAVPTQTRHARQAHAVILVPGLPHPMEMTL